MSDSDESKRHDKSATGRRGITDAEKRLADVLLEQMKSSWHQFNGRRDYEFKVTLTLWSGLAAAVAGSLTLDRLANVFYGQFALVTVAIAVVALHIYWCWGVNQAQAKDRAVALFYERELQDLTGTQFPSTLIRQLGRGRRTPGLLRWTLFVELAITSLLAATLVSVNWNRVSGVEPTRAELEKRKLQLEIEHLESAPPSRPRTGVEIKSAPKP